MADSKSVTSGSNATSDEVSVDADAIMASLVIKADNAGTPASGDTLDVSLLANVGDPDADPDSADEFTSTGHGLHLTRLDTNTDDPAISYNVPLPLPLKGFKLYAENNAASNSITVSAQMASVDINGNRTLTQVAWT